MKQSLFPDVFWAQQEDSISLKINLKEVKEEDLRIEFTEDGINFSAIGLGAQGINNYHFSLDFFIKIQPEACTYKLFDTKIEVSIKKQVGGFWNRLQNTPQKPHWLRIDFDRWQSEDFDDIVEDLNRDVMKDYPKMYDKLQKEEYGYIKEKGKIVYLVLYNLSQFIGFLYILTVMSIRYSRHGPNSMPETYETVGNAFKFCQLMQFLEVMHPIFGYTKGGALVPFMQVTGRAFVLFIMIDSEERMQTKPVVFYLFLVWASIEIVRYPYYITQLVKREVGFLTWLRYTIWIPLYPFGVICEGIIILRNIPYFEETKRFTLQLPNKWNLAFDMPMFLKLYLIFLILPGIYFMMSHMAKTRAKKLGPKDWRKYE